MPAVKRKGCRMNVPFVDFKDQYQAVQDEIRGGMDRVLARGNFILGEEVAVFEREFSAYCGVAYGVGVNSGTDALFFALSAAGVSAGDEVILPAHTFIATALCVSYLGAKPVFADIDPNTYTLDPESFEKAVTPRTKAVIPVHLYGQPADMDEINAVAKKNGIKVIEDAAQAHGAFYQGRRAGSLGDAACFSFYPTKNLGAFGDGGIVVTQDQDMHDRVVMLRDYGRVGRYEHKVKGYNSRLDTLQAVVLSAKLKRLDEWNAMRAEVAEWYREELSDTEGIVLPEVRPDRTCVFHLYVVRVKNRDAVLEAMKAKGIGVLIHYPIPIHLQPAFADAGYKKGNLPVSEKAAQEILSLPMFPHMTREQVAYVAGCLKEILK